jgi:poly-gamma-glutamate capsule biosynthesis protein CapA/YwtB (metallophosphatase superfamily)
MKEKPVLTMTKRLGRRGLVAIIAIELLGAVVALRWAFHYGRETQPAELWIDPGLPAAVGHAVRQWASAQPGRLAWADGPGADLTVSWQQERGARRLADIVLVPVARFPSLRDGVASEDLKRAWSGQDPTEDQPSHLFVSAGTAAALEALLGPRGVGSPATIVAEDDVAGRLWAEPGALGLVPFDRLEPRLKVLSLDGLVALDRDLDLGHYPLLAPIWVRGPEELEGALVAYVQARGLASNRHLERLTVLVMTGVTALTRQVALQIEARADPAWPARQIGGLLSAADLTHVSNEVSFMSGCQAQADSPAFCARPDYLETLRLCGVDVVELTGNHNLDFGPESALGSLDLYAATGIKTFGGGRDAADARRPLLIAHHNNRLAFLGYNQYGPDYAWATEDGPGAAPFSLDAVRSDVARVRAQADLVLVSVQYTETYDTAPLPAQVDDFRAIVEAGADVVTGSQAHQPQSIEFYQGKPIFYGLGNLFFDQTWSDDTRQSLVLRHFIYEGRLVSTQLIPTTMGDDFQPYAAQGEERTAILRSVFAASGW